MTIATHSYQHFTYHGISSYLHSSKIFNTIFHYTQQLGDSRVSSDPFGVCLCNESGYFNCSIKNYTIPRSIYPGEAFNISAIAVGQKIGVAPAVIQANVISSPHQYLFKASEHSENPNNGCVTHTYMLHSKNQREILELDVEQSRPDAGSFYYKFWSPIVTVSLYPCPWGFTLQHDPPYCDCDPLLVGHKLSCNINKQTIH